VYLIALYSFGLGNPKEILQPFDADSKKYLLFYLLDKACGIDLGYENYPYIYFVTPDEKYLFRTVCVETCPVLDPSADESDESLQFDCFPNSVVAGCSNHPSVAYP
jgi:hypothetical protein